MKKTIALIIITCLILSTPVTAKEISKNVNNSEVIDYTEIILVDDIEYFVQRGESYQKDNQYTTIDEVNEFLKGQIANKYLQISTLAYSDLPLVKDRLGTNEKALFNSNLWNGLLTLSYGNRAYEKTEDLYESDTGYHNDNADAFRHSYWNALMTYGIDEDWAEDFANAHETDFPNPPLETSMDKNNNSVGRSIGKKFSTPGNHDWQKELKDEILSAVESGKMKRFVGTDIGTLKYLVKTNSSGEK